MWILQWQLWYIGKYRVKKRPKPNKGFRFGNTDNVILIISSHF